MSGSTLINHTNKSNDELYLYIWKKLKLNSLIVVERSSGKVDIVQEVILKQIGRAHV